jgi:hypothetical protein
LTVFGSNSVKSQIPLLDDAKMVPKSKSIKVTVKLRVGDNFDEAELDAFLSVNRGDLTCKAKRGWKCPAELANVGGGPGSPNVE